MKQSIAFWNILLKDMKKLLPETTEYQLGYCLPFAWMLMMFIRTRTYLILKKYSVVLWQCPFCLEHFHALCYHNI